jgi:integrase
MKLTDASVRALPEPETGNKITFDEALKRFGVRVTAAGARSFVLVYRTAGRQRCYTIGAFPDWQTSAARQEAKRLKMQIRATNADPIGEIESERSAPTVADLIDRYVSEHLPRKRPSSRQDDLYLIKRLASLRSLKVADVTFSQIDTLHQKITREGKLRRANSVRSLLSKMFSLAIKWRWRIDNPVKGVERNQENKRERFLTADEIARLNEALAKHPSRSSANAIRLLILTGARRSEVLTARWADFDLSSATWTKPATNTKQKKEHVLPLSGPARLLLADMRKSASSDYLFPGNGAGEHLEGLRRPWTAVCKAANIEGVRVHDLRHTYASVLASSGVSLHIIGGLLGHAEPRTTARYAHLTDDSLRAATERAGHVIAGGKSAEVKPFRRRK